PAVAGVVPPTGEPPVVSARGSPAHPRVARTPAGSSCGRSVRYRIQVPGPVPRCRRLHDELCSRTWAILARLSAIPDAPFGGGPYPLTFRSPASNDPPTAPRHNASSHSIWPTVTPRIHPRAERPPLRPAPSNSSPLLQLAPSSRPKLALFFCSVSVEVEKRPVAAA